MKKLLLSLFFGYFIITGLSAQQNVAGNAKDSIIFESTTHNYGTITQGSDGSCEFRFTNKGKTPIIITHVSSSCGCTAPDWSKAPVNPGDTGFVKAVYNTQILGVFSKTISVSSNAANSAVLLTIKGEVVPKK
jgi:hypothetical protein